MRPLWRAFLLDLEVKSTVIATSDPRELRRILLESLAERQVNIPVSIRVDGTLVTRKGPLIVTRLFASASRLEAQIETTDDGHAILSGWLEYRQPFRGFALAGAAVVSLMVMVSLAIALGHAVHSGNDLKSVYQHLGGLTKSATTFAMMYTFLFLLSVPNYLRTRIVRDEIVTAFQSLKDR